MTRAAALLLCIASIAVAACAPPPPAALAPLPEEARLYYDNAGGIRDSGQTVIRDAAEFNRVWHRATGQAGAPAPVVNFSHDMVLVVAGGRMSPADQIHVDSVGVRRESTASGKQVDVLGVVFTVSQACRQFSGDAYPVEIVRVRRYNGNVRFVGRRQRGSDCR